MQRFFIRGPGAGELPRIQREQLATVGAYLREVYRAPFRADAEEVRTHTVAEQENHRRAAILRMILFTTAVLVGGIAVPMALGLRLPGDSVVVLTLTAALAIFTLVRCQGGHVLQAALLFVGGGMALGLGFGSLHAGGIDAAVLSAYSSITIYILIAALLLPALIAWPLNVAALTLTIFAVALVPLAPGLIGASGADATKTALLAQLVAAEMVTAVLGSIAARSTRASLEAAAAAFAREREVATLKERFLVEINHELRTPIMAWYGNTELLEQLGEQATPENRAHMVNRALQAGDSVLGILNQLLAVGVLDTQAPAMHPEVVPVASLIENVLTHFAASTNLRDVSREVTLQVASKLHAWADEKNSSKVIEHLITNAVKFSPPGAPIAISAQEVYAARRRVFARMAHGENSQPDFVQINVRDHGLGIPRADIPKLFNRFVRLERDITGSVRGMGVGLYQCRLLVEAMGGQIWVESQGIEGYGSTFSFTLPAAPVPRDA